MTHTLHRRTVIEGFGEDFAILCMAAQKYNDSGAGEKLKKIYQLVASTVPDNLADDNLGGRLTGYSDEEILEHMGDKAYVGATYTDRNRLREALVKIKQADLGMSVVVTGNYDTVFEVLREAGLKPHTVNMSLGIFGKTDMLPPKNVLTIATMCGHGMVPPKRIEETLKTVKEGKCSPEAGGRQLASTCTCGIFNPKTACKIMEKSET